MMRRRLFALARLSRLSMAPLTISVPILGALASDVPLTFAQVLGLGLVGLCAQIFGFALNDLIDYPLDSKLESHRQHPLVSGEISRRAAWVYTLAQLPVSFGLYGLALQASPLGILMLALSVVCSVVYNLWSKWGRLPRFVPELALAVSVGLLCLSGGLLNAPPRLAGAAYALVLGCVLLLVNSVSSGLKDLKTDAMFGARSFVLSTGSRVMEDGRLLVASGLRLYSAALQGVIIVGIIWLNFLLRPGWLAAGVAILLVIYGALHLRMLLGVRSFQALRRSLPLLNGYYNYGALLLLVMHTMSPVAQILVILYVLSLLAVPLRLMLRVWRGRYAALSQG